MIIAEIAQSHDGSLGILHSYIDALANTGVDAIKFQTHVAEAESSAHEPFRVAFSYEDATRYDYWKRMEFSFEQWQGIKQHCEEKNMEFISSPFSCAAVELLESLKVKRYKIGSGEVNNNLLLEKIALLNKPVILSTGMSSWEEIDKAVEIFQQKNIDLTVLQCTSAYPALPQQWGLNVINELKQRYKVSVGFSDHSGDVIACLAATASGAEVFEFHVVFHKTMFGADAKASLEIDKVTMLVKGIRQIQMALKNPVDKSNINSMQSMKNIFEKSLALNQSLSRGTIITSEHLETKKPKGYGVAAQEYKTVIGKKLKKDKQQWDFLTYDDIE